MSHVKGLKCRECGRLYPKSLIAGCEDCFAPLEVAYDYEAIARVLSREVIESREKTLWRYRELLPLDTEPTVGRASGATPLIARRPSRTRARRGQSLHQKRQRQRPDAFIQRSRDGCRHQ